MIVVGTQLHPADPPTLERQRAAMAGTAALRGIACVNLQWASDRLSAPGWRALAALKDDSVRRSGRAGRRKPIAPEVFDRIAAEAERLGASWFCFNNSDVRLTQRLVDFVAGSDLEVVAVSRTDTGGGEPDEVNTPGTDTVFVRTGWWRRHRARFRPYILGEPVWDNVYTAILLRFGRGAVLNTPGWAFHARHPRAWGSSPFAEYTRWLAALDRPHFSRWAAYHARLVELRAAGASPEEERRAEEAFRAPERGALLQAARVARAGLRYLRAR